MNVNYGTGVSLMLSRIDRQAILGRAHVHQQPDPFSVVMILCNITSRDKNSDSHSALYHGMSPPSYWPQLFSCPGTWMLRNFPFCALLDSRMILLSSVTPTSTSRSAFSPPRSVFSHYKSVSIPFVIGPVNGVC